MTLPCVISLAVGLLTMGLFSGLMFSLIVLLQPKWDQQSAAEYITDIQLFLKVGKGNPIVAVVLLVGLLAPLPGLLTNETLSAEFNILILVSLIVFAVGPLGVTVILNLPTYNAIMSLDAGKPAEYWVSLRRRFHYLNLLRFITSTTAFVLLITAVVLQL